MAELAAPNSAARKAYFVAVKRLIERNASSDAEPSARAYGFALPAALTHLVPAMDSSRTMLELEDDWDEQGSPGYAEGTWNRAVAFLVDNAILLWQRDQTSVAAPCIRKGPDGSIDLDWHRPNRELLLNIPANGEDSATYYGDDGAGGHAIKGDLNLSTDNRWLLLWLTE